MKRTWKVLLAVILLSTFLCPLSGCKQQQPAIEDTHISLCATFFPLYALTEALIADVPDVSLSCLIQPQDGCLRSYALSDWDLLLLTRSAEAIIAGGEGLESFESILLELANNGYALSEVLVGMDLFTQEAPDNSYDQEELSHIWGKNPHIYLHTDGAIEILNRISAYLTVLDPQYSEIYENNLAEVQNRLESVKQEIQSLSKQAQNLRVAILNEALIYPALEFGLEVAGWIDRESGQAMDSMELESCIESLEEMNAQLVLIEKQAPAALVDALQAAGYRTVLMDTLSTRRANEGFEGYLATLRANAQALSDAISSIQEGVL